MGGGGDCKERSGGGGGESVEGKDGGLDGGGECKKSSGGGGGKGVEGKDGGLDGGGDHKESSGVDGMNDGSVGVEARQVSKPEETEIAAVTSPSMIGKIQSAQRDDSELRPMEFQGVYILPCTQA